MTLFSSFFFITAFMMHITEWICGPTPTWYASSVATTQQNTISVAPFLLSLVLSLQKSLKASIQRICTGKSAQLRVLRAVACEMSVYIRTGTRLHRSARPSAISGSAQARTALTSQLLQFCGSLCDSMFVFDILEMQIDILTCKFH